MRRCLRLLTLALLGLPLPVLADTYFVTVAGLGGEKDYEERFTEDAKGLDRLLKAAPQAHVRTLSGAEATRTAVLEALTEVAHQAHAEDEFVLILIGHGSFDGVQYKFNLPGPDLAASTLAESCNRIAARRQLIVNTTSSSGGGLDVLVRPGRAVIAATKSGTEKNATVFARFWVSALGDPAADVDKDERISALEAFEYAATKTAAYYESQKRLATEHAVFEDTGKGSPVRAADLEHGVGRLLSSLTLVRLGAQEAVTASPERTRLLARREQLQQRIDTLKYQRAAMSPQDYRQAMTEALVALAKVQQELDK